MLRRDTKHSFRIYFYNCNAFGHCISYLEQGKLVQNGRLKQQSSYFLYQVVSRAVLHQRPEGRILLWVFPASSTSQRFLVFLVLYLHHPALHLRLHTTSLPLCVFGSECPLLFFEGQKSYSVLGPTPIQHDLILM